MRGRFLYTVAFIAAAIGRPVGAQVVVNYGTGAYGAYRSQLADFLVRAGDLEDAINSVHLSGAFCTAAERATAGKALAELRVKLGDLQRDYGAFKGSVSTALGRADVLRQFVQSGEANPGGPNFWTPADREILQHPAADLAQKRAEFASSKVVPCTPPSATTPPVSAQPVPPPRGLGLARPAVQTPKLPQTPAPFCTEADRKKWIDDNIRPALDAMIAAANALRNYTDNVWDKLHTLGAEKPRDEATIGAAEGELKWGMDAHAAVDSQYVKLMRMMRAAVVVDCTHRTAQQQSFDSSGAERRVFRPDTNRRVATGRTTPATPVDRALPAPQSAGKPASPPAATSNPTTPTMPGAGGSQPTPPPVDAPKPENAKPKELRWLPGVRLRVEGFGDVSEFHSFQPVVGDQPGIDHTTGGNTTSGWGVGAEVLVRHWLVGVCRHTNQLHYSQFFLPTAPGNPGQIGGTLNGTFWDGYTGPRFDYHGLEVDPLVGLTYALDDLFLEQRLSSAVLPRHTLTSLKTNFGLTLGLPVYQSLDLRLGAYHTTSFKTGDADSNTRLSFGLRTYIPSF